MLAAPILQGCQYYIRDTIIGQNSDNFRATKAPFVDDWLA